VYFDYQYENGAVTLMQRAALMVEDERSWDATHAAAWSFDRAATHRLGGSNGNSIALVKTRSIDAELRRQLAVLSDVASIVYVGDTERGAPNYQNASASNGQLFAEADIRRHRSI
jgi:hypothetical protein